jgi:hypothetical protein
LAATLEMGIIFLERSVILKFQIKGGVLTRRPDTTGVLPHGIVEMSASIPHFHRFGPWADRSAYYALC